MLSQQSQLETGSVAESNGTRNTRLTVGQRPFTWLWNIFNNLIYFGVLTVSYLIGLSIWFSLLAHIRPEYASWERSGELGSFAAMMFVMLVLFLMNRVYRWLGIETPVATEYKPATSKRLSSTS